MNMLENLNTVANRQLGGLNADSALLAKIRIRAAEEKTQRKGFPWKPVAGVAAAMACIVLAFAVLPADSPFSSGKNLFSTRSAGDAAVTVTEEPSSITQDMITMSGGSARQNAGLFDSFAVITVREAAYRMLSVPADVSRSLLGNELGKVEEFNTEPALGTGSIVSNIAQCGETVYAISGMDASLIAAEVDGKLRLFQRVGYAGTAIKGNETLSDVLCKAEDVAWIRTGDTMITDGARNIFEILLQNADYESTAFTAGDSLQIGLKNGLTLQLYTSDDCISACGTWCCPEFFDALRVASAQ